MIANVKCQTCGSTGKFDCGADCRDAETATEKINAQKLEHCPFGHHVELAPIEYQVISMEEGEAPTIEEWKATMEAKGLILWDSAQAVADAGIEVTAFSWGVPIANIKGKDFMLNFSEAPDGKRYYHAYKEDYEARMAS